LSEKVQQYRRSRRTVGVLQRQHRFVRRPARAPQWRGFAAIHRQRMETSRKATADAGGED
jgi:hypothetical protein